MRKHVWKTTTGLKQSAESKEYTNNNNLVCGYEKKKISDMMWLSTQDLLFPIAVDNILISSREVIYSS